MKKEIVIMDKADLNELISSLSQNQPKSPDGYGINRPLSIHQASELLGKATGTIYNLVYKNRIPFHKKSGRLYFFEEELVNWIKSA